MHRRHLDVGQRSVIGGEYLRITLELESDQGATQLSGASGKKPSEARIEAAATALNVSRTSINKAAALI